MLMALTIGLKWDFTDYWRLVSWQHRPRKHTDHVKDCSRRKVTSGNCHNYPFILIIALIRSSTHFFHLLFFSLFLCFNFFFFRLFYLLTYLIYFISLIFHFYQFQFQLSSSLCLSYAPWITSSIHPSQWAHGFCHGSLGGPWSSGYLIWTFAESTLLVVVYILR